MTEQTKMYDLPDAIVETLLCSHCNAYVSCGPVKLQSDGAIFCGRCSQLSNEDSASQVLFEVAMAKFTFPCQYKLQGCKKRVLFNHAVEHENECPYRTVCCPSLPYNSCLEDVSAFDVYDHFKEAHVDLILKNGRFKLEFDRDVQCNLLMAEYSVIVAVQYIYDSIKKMLHLDVKHFSQGNTKVYYKLQIVSGCDSDSTVNVKGRRCDPYESHTLNMQSAATLIMDNYLPVLENPNFVYINIKLTVNVESSVQNENILSSVITSIMQSVNEDEEKALAAWNELEHIRCGCCNLFAIPPVLLYPIQPAPSLFAPQPPPLFSLSTTPTTFGSLVHSSNSSYSSVCYGCKNNIGQNVTERKIEVKNYPCRWRGCTFMGNDSNIEKHVESCQFRTFICPVSTSCEEGYFMLNNVMQHMQRHGTYCPNPEKIVMDLFCEGSDESALKVYFTLLENRVIAFTCDISAKYQWQFFGNTKNLNVGIYFEHDHCRFKSKTFTLPGEFNCSYKNYVSSLPECFKSCRRISAVLNIANKIK